MTKIEEINVVETVNAIEILTDKLVITEVNRPVAIALNMAIEALGKQMPKKPIDVKRLELYDCIDKAKCPTCKNEIMENEKHCPDCGQAINWEGVE